MVGLPMTRAENGICYAAVKSTACLAFLVIKILCLNLKHLKLQAQASICIS